MSISGLTALQPVRDVGKVQPHQSVLVMWGRHDRMVPLRIAEAAAMRHGWPLHVADRAAHAPHIEQPDAFVETLLAATAGNGGR